MMRVTIYNKVYKTTILYIQLWVAATLLAWMLVSIFGYGSANYPDGGNVFEGAWRDYSWGDFCFDGVAMGVLIALSMVFNAYFIHLFKPLQDYRGRAFLYSVLLLAMNVAVSMFIMKCTSWIWGEEPPHNEFVNCTYMYCLVAVFVSSIHANISFQRMYMRQQQEKHELELKAARQEEVNLQTSLMALKTQVDPHFLFNNFSILGDLIDESPAEAKDFLDSLSKVYRFKLVNMNTNLVGVEAELKMVHSYAHLLECHYGAALRVSFPSKETVESLRGYSLPPLAVQMAVENAVKHNARSMQHPLDINIEVKADHPEIIVTNPIRPLSSKVESTGLGLKNLTARYGLTSGLSPTIERDAKQFRIHLPLIIAGSPKTILTPHSSLLKNHESPNHRRRVPQLQPPTQDAAGLRP